MLQEQYVPNTSFQRTQVRALRGLGPLNSDREASQRLLCGYCAIEGSLCWWLPDDRERHRRVDRHKNHRVCVRESIPIQQTVETYENTRLHIVHRLTAILAMCSDGATVTRVTIRNSSSQMA